MFRTKKAGAVWTSRRTLPEEVFIPDMMRVSTWERSLRTGVITLRLLTSDSVHGLRFKPRALLLPVLPAGRECLIDRFPHGIIGGLGVYNRVDLNDIRFPVRHT
jgi:hypothetical protein